MYHQSNHSNKEKYSTHHSDLQTKTIALGVSFSPSTGPPPPAPATACAQQVRHGPPLQNGSLMEQPPNSTAIPAPNAAIPQRRPTIKISGRLPRIPNRIN